MLLKEYGLSLFSHLEFNVIENTTEKFFLLPKKASYNCHLQLSPIFGPCRRKRGGKDKRVCFQIPSGKTRVIIIQMSVFFSVVRVTNPHVLTNGK